MRKLFAFLFFIVLFFVVLPVPADAAVPCEITPASILAVPEPNDYVINSGGNLTGNQPVDVYIIKSNVTSVYLRLCTQGRQTDPNWNCYANASASTNANGNIRLNGVDLSKLGGTDIGATFNVFVVKDNQVVLNESDSNNLCSVMTIEIQEPQTGGAFCRPLTISPETPTTNEKIKLNPFIAAGVPGFGSNDEHAIVIKDASTGKQIRSITGVKTPALEGYELGPYNAGNYKVEIKDQTIFGSVGDALQCDVRFCVNAKGSCSYTLPAGYTACYYCPEGTTWNKVTQLCINNDDSSLVDPLNDPCPPNTVCIAGHTQNSEGSSNCPAVSGSGISPGDEGTRSDLCPNGRCPNKVPSGLGVNLPTNAEGFIQTVLGIALSVAGGIATVLIIVSGYKLMVSRGNPQQLEGAREQLTAAIVGLLFVIFSLVILEFIGTDILGIFQ